MRVTEHLNAWGDYGGSFPGGIEKPSRCNPKQFALGNPV